jgi:hypothetical protein
LNGFAARLERAKGAIVREAYDDQVSEETKRLYQKKQSIVHPFAARPGIPAGFERKLKFRYDEAGREVAVVGILEGEGSVDRHHAAGLAVAPLPESAAQNGEVTLVSRLFDVYGHVTREERPCGACNEIAYDSAYAALPKDASFDASGDSDVCGPRRGRSLACEHESNRVRDDTRESPGSGAHGRGRGHGRTRNRVRTVSRSEHARRYGYAASYRHIDAQKPSQDPSKQAVS